MDIDEWEILPTDGGLIELSEGDSNKKIFQEKLISRYYDPKGVFNMDYFRCPQPNSRKKVDPLGNSYTRAPSQLVPVSIHLDLPISNTRNEEVIPQPAVKEEPVVLNTEKAMDPDQDMVSQVFFKKMKENEFVDMKMDSPRSGSSPTLKGIVIPQVDVGSFQFDEEGENMASACSPRKKPRKQQHEVDCDGAGKKGVTWEGSKDGFNIWKWSLTGVGALCSFGIAAATICIFIIGSSHQNNQNNQKLQIQIYGDDKRIKRAVHHATRLNEAISAAVRGSPITRARITSGGYYEGL